MNTLSFLPYGLGWADKESFLKRMMLRENAYYNYTDDFTNNTNSTEVIATYGIITFYYANFIHKHVYHVFTEKNNSLKHLKDENISKLLIKGGDLDWFCNELDVKDCQTENVQVLASFPHAKIYLYELR